MVSNAGQPPGLQLNSTFVSFWNQEGNNTVVSSDVPLAGLLEGLFVPHSRRLLSYILIMVELRNEDRSLTVGRTMHFRGIRLIETPDLRTSFGAGGMGGGK